MASKLDELVAFFIVDAATYTRWKSWMDEDNVVKETPCDVTAEVQALVAEARRLYDLVGELEAQLTAAQRG